MKNKIPPSDEQLKIIREKGNIVITAKPGSGKTFTIVERIKCISEQSLDYQGVIAISFTRKSSHELEVRCKKQNIIKKQSFYGTIDNFYISQIICPFAKHITRTNIQLEVRDNISEYPKYKELRNIKEGLNESLRLLLIQALKEGHIFLEISGETAKFILDTVDDCKKYLKARYTHIFIDEYQDCGDVQHRIFVQLVDEGLVGIAVGDLDQAIYAFNNRYSKYLASLITNKKFDHFEITKNHRCHKSISNYSLKLLGINVEKTQEELRVFKIKVIGSDKNIMKFIDEHIAKIKEKYNVSSNNEIAILCRSNNSAERASNFLKAKNKLFSENELDRYNAYWARLFNDMLQCYFDENIFSIDFVQKYFDEDTNGKPFYKANILMNELFHLQPSQLLDNIDIFIKFGNMVYPEYKNEEIIDVLKKILSDENMLLSYKPADKDEICILTLHKSKGLEFKVVFHMDLYRWIFPFEGDNVTEEDKMQARNLHYVGITRAIEACYLMQGTKRYRTKQNDYIDAIESPFLHYEGLCDLRKDVSLSVV